MVKGSLFMKHGSVFAVSVYCSFSYNQISMRNLGLSVTLTSVSKSISFPSFCSGFHRFHVIYKTSVYSNASSTLTDSVANTDGLKAV